MKKKAIEKIPYLTLKQLSRKKNVENVAVSAIVEVAGEEMLLVEVYENKKGRREVPTVRIALTKKDFGNYFPYKGYWTRGKIIGTTWNNTQVIWKEDERISYTTGVMLEAYRLETEEDLERIKSFTEIEIYNSSEWWEYILQMQQDILREEYRSRSERRYQRRQQGLKDREERTPELPEEKIAEYAEDVLFYRKHYLFYKKHGSRADVACTKCGGVTSARWKPGQSYESQFEKMIKEPKQGEFTACPMCGAMGEYFPKGKIRSGKYKTRHIFLGQRYKESGMLFRYIEVEKEWRLGLVCGEKEPKMYNAYEEISGVEIARAYFEKGKKMQIDYHKHNPYSGKDFWDDCNLYGLNSIQIGTAPIMFQTYEEMKGTILQYSAMKEYQRAAGEINPIHYAERYLQTPQIEMLTKMGLTNVVGQLVKCHYGIVASESAKRPDLFLGIRKEHLKQLIQKKGSIKYLEIMQMEKRIQATWTTDQIEKLAEMGADGGKLRTALQYMSIQQIINRVGEYARCEYGTGCSTAEGRLRSTATTYLDYLEMRETLGYDLHNTVYQHPRDLYQAHQRMVVESNKREQDKHMKEVSEKYSNIKKAYRRLRKKYYYEDDQYIIRPARSAAEIVLEGRTLHHCVGGDTYLSGHNSERNIILFLRDKEAPEIPYITVEIENATFRICQWYGAHDKKPDEKNVDRWIKAYVNRLKCGSLAAVTVDAGGIEIPLPALA